MIRNSKDSDSTGANSTLMKITSQTIQKEAFAFLKAPTYFCYCVAVILTYVHQYLPCVRSSASLTLEEGDSLVFCLARSFGDRFGAFLIFFPAFVIATTVFRDQQAEQAKTNSVTKEQSGLASVLSRYLVQTALLFVPILIAATVAAGSVTTSFLELLRFYQISFVWLLPVLLVETALVQLVTLLTGRCLPAILTQLIVWVITTGSTTAVGDYNSCLAIRHEDPAAYEAYVNHLDSFIINRILVLLIAFLLVTVSVLIDRRKHIKK